MGMFHDFIHRRAIREARRRGSSGLSAEPTGHDFRLHGYLDAEGQFDYEAYRAEQVAGNKRKIDQSWVREQDIAFLAAHVRKRVPQPSLGICHGTRRGLEQAWFAAQLGCTVIGTEISDTALKFPNTLQWDFHEVKPEWESAVDFIYSNSFDHSYDPEKCMNAWMSCLRVGGLCLLEHSENHEPEAVTKLDPFGARLTLMPWLVTLWGKGRYAVREVLEGPSRGESPVRYLAIERFD